MSRFFRITLDKDVVIDDNVTNNSSGWSGEKILEVINNNRINTFEELDDVDVSNKKDKQLVAYSEDTHKFITVDPATLKDAMGLTLNQFSKMGIVGSTTTPYIAEIPISTLDFKLPKLNVLKFQAGTQNVVKTANSFVNGESTGFVADEMIIFDGAAYLKSNLQKTMIYGTSTNNYHVYSSPINMDNYVSISAISIVDSGIDELLSTTGVATDRILVPSGDLSLSNASNIDFFTLTATAGVSGIRIICSVDSGNTWKTFSNNTWQDVNLTMSDMATKGMVVEAFNALTSAYWNLLITTGKIRFAYLILGTNVVSELTLQYDGIGSWLECKDTTYDVVYASNNLLQVKFYFSGDIKINY